MTAAPPGRDLLFTRQHRRRAPQVLPAESATPPAPGGTRLDWLDALRGIAALAVVYTHFALEAVPELFQVTNAWFGAGTFGVFLFFVISGYIVPASLERRRSVRGFWVSRIFRLYPLWIFALVAAAALAVAGLRPLAPFIEVHRGAALAAHLTFLQQLIRVESAVNVMWTLSLEMAFYCLVVVLFVLGAHRRSAELSVGFAGAAVAGGVGLIPALGLQHRFGWKTVLVAVCAVFVIGLALSLTGRRPLVIAGALALGTMGLALLVLNQEGRVWYFLLLPAAMFTGTALYRAEQNQIPWWKAGGAAAVVGVVAAANGLLFGSPPGADWRQALAANRNWLITLAATVAVFAAGRALRRHRFPRVLTWLGLVSYSTYLLHPLIHQPFRTVLPGQPLGVRIGLFLGWFAALFAGAWLTYRFIEAPCQRMGRAIARALDVRFGPDTMAGRIPRARRHPDEPPATPRTRATSADATATGTRSVG